MAPYLKMVSMTKAAFKPSMLITLYAFIAPSYVVGTMLKGDF